MDSFTNESADKRPLEKNSPAGRSNTIDLWCIDLTNSKLDSLRSILSADEVQRANKFVFDKDRNTLVRSRVALRMILGRCLNLHPGKITFSYNEQGKPELELSAPAALNFNLSHSGEMALIAVSRDRRVGVDLNQLGQAREWQPIAKRSFSSAEQASLFRLPESAQETLFYRIWSQKEAYTKALGDGFSYGFQNFTVAASASANASAGLVADDKSFGAVDEWAIEFVELGEEWIAALAYDGSSTASSLPTIQLWVFCYDK